VGGLNVLHHVGVNITPILAGVGILSLAVGFGAQTLVKDVINGLFILVEDSIAVGDVVTIRGTGGLVEAVNVRTIRLRDLQGSVHIIPNSQVDMITNMTMDYSYYALDVRVAYREDTDAVVAALQEIDAEMRADPTFAADMLAPIEILGVDQFTDSAVVIKARLKTKPIKQWSVGREFNRRMKKLFDARGIEIPFPQRTISWSEPKHGRPVPLPLQITNLEALAMMTGKGDHETATRHQGNADVP
jgi:small conductance mechanosensitive channel